ncbi:orotidine 5'-phosphate decarboxylase / HUMPS family protein [Lactobacillus melliventris]|uniref:3-hexulose-6-phosphate synthase n=1 Tax=Lactobacillus melliventris TaxID=1218507 RepID=A0ABX5MYH9_9LACO|nr:orotidine 5'-phosphate decarboxylase / HUMPS family protein [Lactobacillus melliventris]PXY83912.1 3-hexulose-6-phosphate synthase [Lactobacillus melliventris]
MKLQVAIDRVSLTTAVQLARKLDGIADIVEFGTSIIKDYGFYEIKAANVNLKHSLLLLDTKTNDEGQYEFEQGFKAGADILTVMGTAGPETLASVYEIAEQKNREVLIDLMGMSNNSILEIAKFPNAIYNLHNSHDAGKNANLLNLVSDFRKKFPTIKNIAVAGSIDLEQAKKLAVQNEVQEVIVGSKIVQSNNPINEASKFKEIINLC